ncbi:MAG TPA: complex I NDUFA9 subunit family protein [Gammaproteobacteria bacterium]|nr:complex I NDUFA9 subunit family protein [Gammaproteobacteria bacterium]
MALRQRERRVLLLGGSGFVGRKLAAALRRHGYDVRVPTRNRAHGRRLLVLPEVELVQADVHHEATLARLLHGCEAAINLVGIVNEPRRDGSGFERVHVELAAKLVRACGTAGVRRLLQMSALKADAERAPSHYLRSKGKAERILAGSNLDYTIFRPSLIFGAEDSFTNRFAGLLRRLPVLPLPRPEARFAPVFVDDVAATFIAALGDSRTYGATYELCGPDVYSLLEIVRWLRDLLGLKRAILPLPDGLGRLQARLAEYLPGKPMSLDNFASLGVASVCDGSAAPPFGSPRRRLVDIVPTYLGGAGTGATERLEERLARLRRSARR